MKLSIEEFAYLDSASLFAGVADHVWAMFLDSGICDGKPPVTKHADYDVLAINPIAKLITNSEQTVVEQNNEKKSYSKDPFSLIRQTLIDNDLSADDLNSFNKKIPSYLPGAIGYFSYDLVRRYEDLGERTSNKENFPEMAIGIYPVIVLVDHRRKVTSLISMDGREDTSERVNEWRSLINQELAKPNQTESLVNNFEDRFRVDNFHENMNRDDYQTCFDQVKRYIVNGDCYQVNLAKQFSVNVSGDSWQSYAYLRKLSPAPYGAYMNLPFAKVLSNSPESFIQCRNRQVVTSPIKGTRPRHENKLDDQKASEELFNSSKDRAENLMIVDLMRNDLSTCCEYHSVKVTKLFAVHSFANVHHLISTVTGVLRKGLHSLDLLKKCFPGGSITGAPKIRAMQIIEELEPDRRGLYCGAIGYIGLDGSMETNIAIRTIVVKDEVAYYSAGGGLVIDSDVDKEYQEILDKGFMIKKTLSN